MKKFLNQFLNKKVKKKIKETIAFILRKNMKVGVSYNLFDGEELLPYSIKQIRKNVNYISVVYQLTSNLGNPASNNLEKKLEQLKEKGLIDELHHYEPDFKLTPHENEKKKRDIGLELAKKHGCTHFMSMDTDEFYEEEQFDYALDYIMLHNIKTSAVGIVEYLKEPENQLIGTYTFIKKDTDLYNFYVPFIIKINKFKTSKHGKGYFPCYTDPTRKLFHSGRFRLFPIQEIVMHHMATIRLDLDKKYDNSSFLDSSKEVQEHLKNIQQEVLAFDFEKSKTLPEDCAIFRKNIVRKVDNKFKIEIEGAEKF